MPKNFTTTNPFDYLTLIDLNARKVISTIFLSCLLAIVGMNNSYAQESSSEKTESMSKNMTEQKAKEYTPETIVQEQIIAYNARDIDAFMATYTDDIAVYTHPNTLMYQGQEPMRARYGKMFDNTPDLFCTIENRTIIGDYVIDKERVIKNGKIIHAVAIYHVRDNLIDKVWFIK